jgi:hypothetical protein
MAKGNMLANTLLLFMKRKLHLYFSLNLNFRRNMKMLNQAFGLFSQSAVAAHTSNAIVED